ncbi:MAG: ATP-dependent DNA helicase RecG [Helicobacter sp.]|nr:ATP-dependent DNA helicase RecG [Helicobacter sp.]MDY5741177.1 ATP-dependent DNA helicase RecG [Helicobacter sp.]
MKNKILEYASLENAYFGLTKNELKSAQENDLKSLFDVLLCAPKGYEYKEFLKSLDSINSEVCVRVQIIECKKNYAKSYMKITAYMLDFSCNIELIVFHPKPFMMHIFAPHKQCVIYGKLTHDRNAGLCMIQPKILTENAVQNINTIDLKFKTTPSKTKTIKALIPKLITLENLLYCKIPQHYAKELVSIFVPDTKFVGEFKANGGFTKKHTDSLKFIEIFRHIMLLQGKRLECKANFVCNGDYKAFIDSLPFKLTQGQNQAIQTIANDLSQDLASRRLIMGDVGCGKTIVILSAVMMAYPKKSVLMAPTSVLAKQLYEEAKKFLPDFIKIAFVTGQTKDFKGQESTTLFGNQKIPADFIIGTQALLYRDLDLSDCALIMSDEQHRFGANQRYKLEKMFSTNTSLTSSKPHSLQFSATPIPRTMAMINSQYINVSTITDLPFKKDITTSIIHRNDFKTLLSHLKSETDSKRQAIIVYPLIEESEHIDYLSIAEGKEFWCKHFDNVYVTSGKDKQKESILEEFKQKGKILLATTVVEVGISLPHLSTIVIVAPERLGLATLHQLRGRVSRNGLKGYCFLYTNAQNTQRLEKFAHTINGFEIAELDLHYRNSGDLLSGSRQSGNEFEFFDYKDKEILESATQIANEHI